VCFIGFRVMVFNATFNNISAITWQSVLLVRETGVSVENHQPAASHWHTWLHIINVVSSTPTTLVVIVTNYTDSCKSKYHTITTTTDPLCVLYSTRNECWYYYYILNSSIWPLLQHACCYHPLYVLFVYFSYLSRTVCITLA